jgi:plastocyanin
MKRTTWLATAVFALAACGGGSDGPTSTTGVATVRMNANAITLFPAQTEQLAATALDAAGAPVAAAAAPTWRSANTSIATVTASGVVTGVANGQTDVTATIDGKVGTTRVTVGNPPLAARVSMPGLSFTPFTTVIARTGTVAFEFPQLAHNVIFKAATGVPADILVTANATVSRQFNTAGSFAYDCTLHPGMAGEVVVR